MQVRDKHIKALREAAKELKASIGYYTGGDEQRVTEIERHLRNLDELSSILREQVRDARGDVGVPA